ncbi:head maturation protease, ClpP-related [uncultured Culturomica sp.]|uniref:head maturation protease, ClpP-related n=1 Tax=uncultured Culturomica sp. TaxID=1926654 RepID=UPI000339E87A|nr:head maturation protease, ClpP-related [uncultured Culturomica sp.]CCZ10511.1 aTP-dependent Clp protease proteolytic subunit [Odoribacter sp. CAG:788]
MKRFFNMIPGESDCCILLYGDIGYYDTRSGEITRELLEAEAAFQKIDFRINSMGGDVYTGIALFNALHNSKADITMYIDGVAASMASVIGLCGKPVYMSKYARLMIHGVSGGCYGNKSEIKACLEEIETLEATLCDMLAKKLNLTPDEIRANYFDGKDHWLTAEEALALGIIDGIYDADPVPVDSTPEQVYALYQNKYSNSLKTENNMFEKLKKRPSFANCATDEDVLKRIDEIEKEAGKVPGLETDKATLQGEVDAYKQKEEQAQEAADETLINTAFDEGRITEPEKAVYRAALKTDRDNTTNALKTLPAKRRVMDNLGKETPPTGESEWTKRQKEIEAKNAKK